jgi:hypothetical protein
MQIMKFTKLATVLIGQMAGLSAQDTPQGNSVVKSQATSSGYGTCSSKDFDKVKITSNPKIKAGETFTITWESGNPDTNLKDTEARVELWVMAGGPARSPVLYYKSDRLFRSNNFTHTWPTDLVDIRDGMGPLPLQLVTFVYGTWAWDNSTQLPSWFYPYYGTQKVDFY